MESLKIWPEYMILWMEEILHQLIGGLSMFIPLFLGFQPSKVVQDLSTVGTSNKSVPGQHGH